MATNTESCTFVFHGDFYAKEAFIINSQLILSNQEILLTGFMGFFLHWLYIVQVINIPGVIF